MHIEIYTIVMK